MSELAFNLNGDPFDVPANAAGWRVRKMKTKGAPEVAYGRNGQPLVLPLEADVDDLRAEVGSPGRYRVDPVDETNKPIANAPAGYVMVHELAAAPAPTPASVVPLALRARLAVRCLHARVCGRRADDGGTDRVLERHACLPAVPRRDGARTDHARRPARDGAGTHRAEVVAT